MSRSNRAIRPGLLAILALGTLTSACGHGITQEAEPPVGTTLANSFAPLSSGVHQFSAANNSFQIDMTGDYWTARLAADGDVIIADPMPHSRVGRSITITSPESLTSPDKPYEYWRRPISDINGWLDTASYGASIGNRLATSLGGRPAIRFEVVLADTSGRLSERNGADQDLVDYTVWWVGGEDADPMVVIVDNTNNGGHPFSYQAEQLLNTLTFTS